MSLRAFGNSHAARDRQAAGFAAQVFRINAFQLDGEQLRAIDDLQVQIANAVVAADDVEVHVTCDVLELIAEELEIALAGGCIADADERIAPAATIGQAEADFDLVGRFETARGAGVDEQFQVIVLGELVGALAAGIGREADDFQLHAPRPRLFAERNPLQPKAEYVARTDRENGDGNNKCNRHADRAEQRATIEKLSHANFGDSLVGRLRRFGQRVADDSLWTDRVSWRHRPR